MSRRKLLVLGGALVLALGATAALAVKAPTPSSGRTGAVVGHLQMRDWTVTMHAGSRYTVRMPDGKLVAENVTVDRLRAFDANLAEMLEQLAAGTAFQYAGK